MKSILGGNFHLEKRLGKGAFGEIYLGIQKHSNKKVAIKLEDANIKYP
jgi:serine/threonine protein kinase